MKVHYLHRQILISLLLLAITEIIYVVPSNAQEERKLIRKGNTKYYDGQYNESEILYRKAIDKNGPSYPALFNLGDALYKQNNFEEASGKFSASLDMQNDKIKKSQSFYNLGNSLLKNNKISESIEAYKNSLRLNPSNVMAKHNLAFAQDMLKKQQEQQQQEQKNQNQDDKKDDKQNDNKNQQDNRQNEQNQQQNQQQQNQQQNQQQQQQQQEGMNREDAARILEALANQEKKVQEKVKDAKAAGERVRTLINW